VQVVAGASHTCALRSNGTAHCWGLPGPAPERKIVEDFVQLSSGDDSACGLRRDGSYRCWGALAFDTRALVVPAE
jgi:alpha-tubulin suppressor-like RCC1 family protein